jgi:hypothetical protein
MRSGEVRVVMFSMLRFEPARLDARGPGTRKRVMDFFPDLNDNDCAPVKPGRTPATFSDQNIL